MKRSWEHDDLIYHFTLSESEIQWLGGRNAVNQSDTAVLLKCFQYLGYFPSSNQEIPSSVIEYIIEQLGFSVELYEQYDWSGRSAIKDRRAIRDLLGFRETSEEDHEELASWLSKHNILKENHKRSEIKQVLYGHLREVGLEPPSRGQVTRIINSALNRFENRFFAETEAKLDAHTKLALDEWLYTGDLEEDGSYQQSLFASLKRDPGKLGVKSLLKEVRKLEQLQAIQLPYNLFAGIQPEVIEAYRQRAATEPPRELRRHPAVRRYTLLACFCWKRQQEVTDNLVKTLILLIQRMNTRAEQRVERDFIIESKQVLNKNALLFRIAEAALGNPDGSIRDVIFPVVSEETLEDLLEEFRTSGSSYQERVYRRLRGSYSQHYRRILPEIFEVLRFQSNNQRYRPLIDALSILERYVKSKQHYYPLEEEIPIEGVIRPGWQDLVVEEDEDGKQRINRINYEMCVLDSLEDSLRSKEVWVPGADHFRNPDEDLVQDFEERREYYYKRLGFPLSVKVFIEGLKQALKEALARLNANIPDNPYVKVLDYRNGWIKVSPLEAQAEPPNLEHLKQEVDRRWHMISLLDMLKETDFRVGFSEQFKSVASRESLSPRIRQKRLLLCIYALGTNIGLRQASMGDHGESYDSLRHVFERYINEASLRAANAQLVNATLEIRLSHIWGEGSMACAADARKVSSRGENLKTEWHTRYKGRGVMIYWHVERGSTAIYSQLKAPSSSEVASMIEGLVRHASEMSLEKSYTDTHGQSEIAFAFCHLLGFQLMPRIKNIYQKKLYLPGKGMRSAYPELQPVLTRPIRWHLFEQQYDEMIKYAASILNRSADTEALLRRFTRNNVQHPTYAALLELGKVIKTIFLCDYLSSMEMRREIHEGLNVIESWNSANSFIFYGKTGEFASSQLRVQQLSVLALQLLQNSLVYINTLMLQRVLSESDWYERMEAADWRGLTPLFYRHVNPYGLVTIDMDERLPDLAA